MEKKTKASEKHGTPLSPPSYWETQKRQKRAEKKFK